MMRQCPVYVLAVSLSWCLLCNAAETRRAYFDGVLRDSTSGVREAHLQQTGYKHHASQLMVHFTEDPLNWTLLCTWSSQANRESYTLMSIMVSMLKKGSHQWTNPVQAVAAPGHNLQNPAWLWDQTSGSLLLIHTRSKKGSSQAGGELCAAESRDGGHTFSEPFPLLPGATGAFVRNPPILLDGRNWLMPVYYTPQGLKRVDSHWSELRFSRDGGRTWPHASTLSHKGSGLVQPSVVELRSSDDRHGLTARLVAFFRSRFSDNVWLSESHNHGRTWTEPHPTRLPQNNKAIQAIRLQSGNVALVMNNNGGARVRAAAKIPMQPLTIALSEDGGLTWPFLRDLEPFYRKGLDYTYPSIVQTEDGLIHVSHTWSQTRRREAIRYSQITEGWIRGQYSWGTTRGVLQPDINRSTVLL